MTGEIADGWLGTCFLPEQGHVFLDDLKAGAKLAGRDFKEIDIQTGGFFELSDDVERLIEARKPAMAFTLGGMGSAKTNFYNDAYCRAGYEDDAKAVQSLWVAGKRDQAIARVPDEMVLLTNLIGTEDMIRARLRAFRDAGVDTFRLGTGGESWKERTAALEEAVDLIQSETNSWQA
jgi:alkanesulfonate monooxygenase SsuD/methylene tetrahydromethanopterin reductase-like flavin-dependent oxidoreductase (luciferase family)